MPLTINSDPTENQAVTIASPTCLKGRGEDATGSLTAVTLVVLTLTPDEVYPRVGFSGCCNQNSLFQVIQDDDGAETILEDFIVGPGQYTHSDELCLTVTAGSSGTQRLLLKALNISNLGCLRGTLTAEES